MRFRDPRWSRWQALPRGRLAGLGPGLVAGVFGGLIAALAWLPEPNALAAASPEAPELTRVLSPETLEASVEPMADEVVEVEKTWWKRPTPMDPADAARHLALAFEEVTGERANNKLVSVLWAQWALETGRGRWMVDYNFAGLKGRAPGGGSALWWTWEETDQGALRRRARFRAYATPEEGARDYVTMLERRYPDALEAAQRGDAATFIRALDSRGYFTEKTQTYGQAVASLAREFMRGELSSRFPDA